jgi:hypothetical protein
MTKDAQLAAGNRVERLAYRSHRAIRCPSVRFGRHVLRVTDTQRTAPAIAGMRPGTAGSPMRHTSRSAAVDLPLPGDSSARPGHRRAVVRRSDLAAARRFFTSALRAGTIPAEVTTDRPAGPGRASPLRATYRRAIRE